MKLDLPFEWFKKRMGFEDGIDEVGAGCPPSKELESAIEKAESKLQTFSLNLNSPELELHLKDFEKACNEHCDNAISQLPKTPFKDIVWEPCCCREGEVVNRPSWKDLMLEIAFVVSKRSHDIQTQCGAVICNDDNEIISTGYNGFMRGIDDTVLPNTRPDKYDTIIHAENNAILNCARQGRSTKGMTIYVTGMPCLFCLQYIWQAGIKKVIHAGQPINMLESDESKAKTEQILELTGLEVEHYTGFKRRGI